MQRAILRVFFIFLILVFQSLIFDFNTVSASETEFSDDFLIYGTQGGIIDSSITLNGVSSDNSPNFAYRIEGLDGSGNYFYGVLEYFVLTLEKQESSILWDWNLPVSYRGTCSCIIHVYQLDYNSEVLFSSNFVIWINNYDLPSEEYEYYPIFVPSADFPNSAVVMHKPFEFNYELNIFADLYFPPVLSEVESSVFSEIKVGVFNYSSVEKNYLQDFENITIFEETVVEIRKFKLHFSIDLENFSEGFYGLDFKNAIFKAWEVEYLFEIDRTRPVPVIVAQDLVAESLESILINASGSFDPLSSVLGEDENMVEINEGMNNNSIASVGEIHEDNLLEYTWIVEDSNGIKSHPREDMLLSPSELIFFPEKSGEYKFTVAVSDGAGNTNSISHIVAVENVVPIGIICDENENVILKEIYYYNKSNSSVLLFNADMSSDSLNEIDELQFGWYLDGVLFSSTNISLIDVNKLNQSAKLELIVKDLDGDSDSLILTLLQFDFETNNQNLNTKSSEMLNGINLVLLTAFICSLILLLIRKKSTEENPLPKWSKYNKKQ